ncbi:unnamed protein product [Larinioides sclopetarius]|uniref:Uncharacterized protein n=1 Tax=Larinioides sclopetarius TaxID=280406 RepID=A0AAV2BS72_9ARAC
MIKMYQIRYIGHTWWQHLQNCRQIRMCRKRHNGLLWENSLSN